MSLVVVLVCSWWGISHTVAQPDEPEIHPGENTLGEISSQIPAAWFRFSATANIPLTLEARSLTSGFAPLVIVYDPLGSVLQHAPNPLGNARQTILLTPPIDGEYRVQVLGVDGRTGQFVLSLAQTTTETLPASELRSGMVIEDRVTPAAPIKRYQLMASPDTALSLQVMSLLPDGGPGLVLSDLDGNPLGTVRQNLLGGSFLIPAGVDVGYELTLIHSGAERIEGFKASLLPLNNPTATNPISQTEGPSALPTIPTPTANLDAQGEVIIPFDGPCSLTTREVAGVNVRAGPGQTYETVGGLFPNVLVSVTGRNEDNSWWQIEYRPGSFGWVADVVVRRGGDCSNIGVAAYPPPLAATPAAMPTETPMPQ